MAEYLNLQVAKSGFGSYLTNIVPEDIAITSGAFSAAMQQIRNITTIPIEKFAQIVNSIETIKGLDSVNGTSVPVDTSLANQGLNLTAKGTGPYGTFTFSDFFGCMSGLPYHWKDIYNGIQDLTTTKLENIYHELFLAVTWEKAYCTITVNPYYVNVQPYIAPTVSPPDPGQPRIDQLYYTVTIAQGDKGGGYGRGTAPTPTVTLSPNNCGASVTTSIGTNDSDAAPNGGGTFGRVTFSISNGSAYNYGTATNSSNNNPPNQSSGPYAPPVESITVQAPPTATLAVTAGGAIATGGTNTTGDTYYSTGSPTIGTAGWPNPMNNVVQGYIQQANDEIQSIFNNKTNVAKALNINYDMAGTQLTVEQRTRYNAIPPVPTPRDRFVNLYPTSQEVFVDTIPELAQDTMPHGAAQTIEAITDVCNPGGQSIVGLMRESRNALRLQELGIEQDNNIPDVLDPALVSVLMSNGTIPGARNGIDVPNTGQKFTNPSNLGISDCSVSNTANNFSATVAVLPQLLGFLDPATNTYRITNSLFDGQGGITQDNPVLGPLLSAAIDGLTLNLGPFNNGSGSGIGGSDGAQAILTGPVQPIGIGVPSQTGSPVLPDSFAGSPYRNVLAPNLNSAMTSGTLTPSIYSVQEAIDEVIRCNCDCWVQ